MKKTDFIEEHVKLIDILDKSIQLLRTQTNGHVLSGRLIIDSVIDMLQQEQDEQVHELRKVVIKKN